MKKTIPKKTLHQLTHMEIHEVSLVDHAANKRRFLIAKRSNPMTQNETTEPPLQAANDDGGAQSPPEPSPDSQAAAHDETRALLKEVLQALRATPTAAQATPGPATVPDAAPAAVPEALAKSLQGRISRLEKYFGMPNSLPPEGSPATTPSKHAWPFDINRPVDDGAAREEG